MKALEGIICIDKPQGFTSFDVVAKLRGMTKTKRIGHAGTLDPMATGVLPVFFGRATKAVDLLSNHDKTYVAELKLGIVTDTQDISGKILSQTHQKVSLSRFTSELAGLVGEKEQIPPMYSAVRVGGRRLYDIARSGGEIERKPRKITVYSANLIDADEKSGVYTIEIACSRGTYIRTLCHDLGGLLGCGAAMTALRRTKACGFSLNECFTLEQVQALADDNALEEKLLPASSAFADWTGFELNPVQAKHFCNGLELGLSQFGRAFDDGAKLAVYGENGRFLGLARVDITGGKLAIIKIFALFHNGVNGT